MTPNDKSYKVKAHRLVFHEAIKRGDLVRKPCEACGRHSKVIAHHDDYDRPLDVRWLCSPHHHEAHGRTARPKKGPIRREGYNPEPMVIVTNSRGVKKPDVSKQGLWEWFAKR